MPLPGSVLDGLNFVPADLGATFYPSVCTFLAIAKTQAVDGQELHTFAAIDAAHTDVPCRKSPLILIRPETQEKSRADFQENDALFQVNLDRYIADILTTWRITVDGTTYEILAVEPDGNTLTTRCRIGLLGPYNG